VPSACLLDSLLAAASTATTIEGQPVTPTISLAKRAVLEQKKAIMKRSSLVIVLTLAFVSQLFAQGKIDLQPSDTILSILQKNMGQTVELRMKSGEKIAGKVEKVGDKLVHLAQLTGAEFFDAAVDTADVAAVVVRTKSK
jgi:hypothetical protein